MNAREAIKYWKVFLKEIAFLKREHSSVDWEEQEQATKWAIEALEKQISKKVDTTGNGDDDFYICPVCKERLESIDAFVLLEEPYCSNCGQKLDWGD